jgi:hypothetical protein
MLTSLEYKKLLELEHQQSQWWGKRIGNLSKGPKIVKYANEINAQTVLDYGCGKGDIKDYIEENKHPLTVFEYDPGIPGKDQMPEPADLVGCFDVLEHVEPEFVDNVIDDLWRVTLKLLLVEISSIPAGKFLSDGRNAHLTQQLGSWWEEKFAKKFVFKLKLLGKAGSHFILTPIK